MRPSIVLYSLIAFLLACSGGPSSAELHIIPTLHGLHATNERYTYDSLRAIVQRLEPHIVAVEMRPSDIGRDTAYLKRNYPLEMWMAPYWFPKAHIVGIDWLGDDLADDPIPEGHWQEAEITRNQRELQADSTAQERLLHCAALVTERITLLQNLSLDELLASRDAELTLRYYTCMDEQLAGTEHVRVLDFFRLRNERMYALIQALVAEHPGKRIVVLTGDDHYVQFATWRKGRSDL